MEIDLSDTELYIPGTSSIDENALKNLSWVDSVEKELSSSLDNRTFLCTSNQNLQVIQYKNIDDIITLPFHKLTDIEILEHQNLIISIMRNNVKKQESLDITDLMRKTDWLINASKYLSNRIGLVLFQHKNSSSNTSIPRSSYKFCGFNYECEFNYNIKKKVGCYAQHYVHNLVYADLLALKTFMTKNNNLEEIQKSINTISYVINHMFEELQNCNKSNVFNNKNNHIERNPKNKKNLVQTAF